MADDSGTEVFGHGGDATWRVWKTDGSSFASSPVDFDVPDDDMGDAGF